MKPEEKIIADRVLLSVLIKDAETETERLAWEWERARRLALLNRGSPQLRLFL